jgi:radical SAM-linked protein
MTWWLVNFSRTGPARYISHLDTTRVVQRTFARAGIELALTQGMRPRPRLSLPLPLPTGVAGLAELAVAEVAEEAVPAALEARLRALRAVCADGVRIERLAACEGRPRPRAAAAAYECRLPVAVDAAADVLRWFDGQPSVRVVRDAPKGRKAIEVKEYVRELSVSPWGDQTRLAFTLRYGPSGAARVDEVVAALAGPLGIEPIVLDPARVCVTWTGLPPELGAPADGMSPAGSMPGAKEMNDSE